MELIERFKYLMKINQLNSSAFADEIGVQRSSVSHILSGRNKPSLEFIQKTIKRFPKVDASWLISGTTSSQSEVQVEEQALDKLNANEELSEENQSVVTAKANEELKASKSNREGDRSIKKVLVFYSDGTFEEFASLNR